MSPSAVSAGELDGGVVAATRAAAEVIEAARELLRGAFPEEWRSPAADGYGVRLLDALVHLGRAADAVDEAADRAAAYREAVAVAKAQDA